MGKEYIDLLIHKLETYKKLMNLIKTTKDAYDIALIEALITYLFPGSKLDKDFLEMLVLEVETSEKEITNYLELDNGERETLNKNNLQRLINQDQKFLSVDSAIRKYQEEFNKQREAISEFIDSSIDKENAIEAINGAMDSDVYLRPVIEENIFLGGRNV